MPVTLILLGFGLVVAGIYFAIGGLGAAAAGGTALKGVSIQGPSWLIMVALGVGVICFGAWQFEGAAAVQDKPETTLPEPGVFIPMFYGDDPVLDALWDECEAGDMQACDDLYQDSPSESEYELFGATCGELIADDGLFCTEVDFTKLPNSD